RDEAVDGSRRQESEVHTSILGHLRLRRPGKALEIVARRLQIRGGVDLEDLSQVFTEEDRRALIQSALQEVAARRLEVARHEGEQARYLEPEVHQAEGIDA